MKTCPVCKATVFDDMDVCYGCLYRFSATPGAQEALQNTLLIASGAGASQAEPKSVQTKQEDMRTETERERIPPEKVQGELKNKRAGAENVKAICLPLLEQETQPLDAPRVQKWTLKIELSIPKVGG